MKKLLAVILMLAFMAPALVGADEMGTSDTNVEVKWYDKFDFLGDLRYRFEMMKDEGVDARYRHRLRARFGFIYALLDEVDLGLRLASSFNDPVSTNQTMGNGFSGKALRIDWAFFDYHPTYVKGFHFKGGKFKNAFHKPVKSELLWDGDLNPEGLFLAFGRDLGNFHFYGNGAALYVEERSTAKDSWLLGIQTGGKYKLMDGNLHFGAGIGFFYFTNLKNRATLWDNTDAFGNTTNAAGNYMFDYHELEFYAEAGGKIYEIPVAVVGDFVKNVAKNVNDDLGWLVGLSVGKAKKPWTGAFRYNYRDIKADAVVGVFTDSDFRGGGTDGKGHEFVAEVVVLKGVKLALDYFFNYKGVNNGTKFHRMMLDLKFKI